jgi:flagellar hook assembly protein FlgD
MWDGNDKYGIKVPPGGYIIKFIGLENASTLKSLIVR